MKKNRTIVWVCSNSDYFYRSSGEVQSRLDSVLSKLTEKGYCIHVLLPYDATLLPKTKVAPARISKQPITLTQTYSVEFIKLTRSNTLPSIHMVKLPILDPAMTSAALAKAGLIFAQKLKKPIDLIHVFGWQSALLPYYLDTQDQKPATLQRTKTFLTIKSLSEQGNFSPEVLPQLGIPELFFHPDGLEFYGQFSFLKTGAVFADGISVMAPPRSQQKKWHFHNGAQRFQDILKWQSSKVHTWTSDRGINTYIEAYDEIIVPFTSPQKAAPLLEKIKKKAENFQQSMLNMWGPPQPSRYHQNVLTLLAQSPRKAFSYWEWASDDSYSEYGLILDDIYSGHKRILARGLSSFGDFWMDVEPDKEYAVEFAGWTPSGEMRILIRSNTIRTARETPSANKNAVFIDVRTKQRVTVNVLASWLTSLKVGGGSSGGNWLPPLAPASSLLTPRP